jgi:hypothetical protein
LLVAVVEPLAVEPLAFCDAVAFAVDGCVSRLPHMKPASVMVQSFPQLL